MRDANRLQALRLAIPEPYRAFAMDMASGRAAITAQSHVWHLARIVEAREWEAWGNHAEAGQVAMTLDGAGR